MQHELECLEQSGYKELLAGKTKPQMIFFSVEWSEPCRRMKAVVQELAGNYYATADFYQADADDQPLIAADFNIASVPALVVWQEGDVAERIVGMRAYGDLEKALAKYL